MTWNPWGGGYDEHGSLRNEGQIENNSYPVEGVTSMVKKTKERTEGKCPYKGWRADFVKIVLGWKWFSYCGGTAHWNDPKGKCRSFFPGWLDDLGRKNAQILINHHKKEQETEGLTDAQKIHVGGYL